MKSLPKQVKRSLTYDQGSEMAEHKLFTKDTKIKVFFAHPGCPWERGTNENTNGLIRDFFPKRTNFNQITRREIKHVQKLLSKLGNLTNFFSYYILKPYEIFNI